MRTLLLLLISYTTIAQPQYPQQVYSQHTRLGMNGPIKSVTTYKYTRLKYKPNQPEKTKGILYSVIKNYYDTSGLITKDSTAIIYNRQQQAYGYCKTYTYTIHNNTPAIHIYTQHDCVPPHDNKSTLSTIVTLTQPDSNAILAREYDSDTIPKQLSQTLTSYRFTVSDSLIIRTVFNASQEKTHHHGTSTYQYDAYRNFTHTTLTIGNTPQQTIKHDIQTIDDYGNALYMLNFTNNSTTPEFMTRYEYEYYE